MDVMLTRSQRNALVVAIVLAAAAWPATQVVKQLLDTNLTQIAGNAVSAGNGVSGTGVQRVTIASDSTGVVGLSAGTNNIGDVDVLTFPDNEPVDQSRRGGVDVVAGRCEREEPIFVSISQTAGTQLAGGTASERIFICSLHLVTATAQNIALVSGTGSVCGTSTSGVEGFGGSTAATGWNLAANSGIVLPVTTQAHGRTDTNADNLCLLQSGSGQVSGGLSYVSIAP